MSIDIVRAWKDATYRASLSAEEQVLLPVHPAGTVELSDAELEMVHGATGGKGKEREVFINNNKFDSLSPSVIGGCTHTAFIDVNLAANIVGLLSGADAKDIKSCPHNDN